MRIFISRRRISWTVITVTGSLAVAAGGVTITAAAGGVTIAATNPPGAAGTAGAAVVSSPHTRASSDAILFSLYTLEKNARIFRGLCVAGCGRVLGFSPNIEHRT